MEKQSRKGVGLGMLAGIVTGGAIGVLLSAKTGNAVYYGATGVGAVIGMIVGTVADRARESCTLDLQGENQLDCC